MNRRIIIIIVIVIIALLLGVMFLAPFFFGAGFNASMQVTWLDENENPISGPYAFLSPLGTPIVGVQVDGSWTLTSSSGAPVDSPYVSGMVTITVRLNTITAGVINTVTRGLVWSAVTSGEFTETWSLSTLIGVPTQAGKDNGWSVTFVLDLDASAILDGDTTTATDSDKVSYAVSWTTDTLLLDGIIVVP